MGLSACNIIEKEFTEEILVEKVENIYRELMEKLRR